MNNNRSNSTKYIIALIAIVVIASLMAFLFLTTANKKSDAVTAKEFTEGPHFLINKDQVKMSTILVKGNEAKIEEKSIWKTDIVNQDFTVKISNDGDEFSIKPTLKCLVPESHYPAKEHVVVVSDIEGDFDYFKNILIGNEVMDKSYNWTYGTGSLVVLGDIFDRGDKVTECVWLIYRLEQLAEKAGGKVHTILGNHEIMVLSGDHRYVHGKYERILNAVDIKYKDLFAPETVLGSWLRSKNTVEIIGETLFSHAGMSPRIVQEGITINEINEMVRLEADQGYVHPQELPDDREIIMGAMGPLWYRGYVNEETDDDMISEIVDYFDVKHIVIGHTLVNDVTALFGKKIIAIDVDKSDHNKEVALLFESGEFYKINKYGTKTLL